MCVPREATGRDADSATGAADAGGIGAQSPFEECQASCLEKGRLMPPALVGRIAVTLVLLLASLGFVTWRQSRALETLATLDELRRSTSVARAQVVELDREIQFLESRARVVPAARGRLSMHTPDGSELVILLAQEVP